MNLIIQSLSIFIIFMILNSCTFHSSQLSAAKAMLSFLVEREELPQAFWWKLDFGQETTLLFPVVWDGVASLTDGKRWIFVVKDDRVNAIVDLEIGRTTRIGYLQRQCGENAESSPLDSCSSTDYRVLQVSVTQYGVIREGGVSESRFTCLDESKVSEGIKQLNCANESGKFIFAVTDSEPSGSIRRLMVSPSPGKNFILSRTNHQLSAESVRAYLTEQ